MIVEICNSVKSLEDELGETVLKTCGNRRVGFH